MHAEAENEQDGLVSMGGWGQIVKKKINKRTGKVEKVQRHATTADAMAASSYLNFLEEYFEKNSEDKIAILNND